MSEHKKDCGWHKDWHNCSRQAFDVHATGSISPLGFYVPYVPLQVSSIFNPCKEIELGVHEIPRCHLVIPGTVIACGEMGQYCSEECLKKATDKV